MEARTVPYMSKGEMSDFFRLSRPTIDKLVKGIWNEIPGRYPRYAIAGRRINLFAMIDFMTYKEWLEDDRLRKQVPVFNPVSIARMCGQEGVAK